METDCFISTWLAQWMDLLALFIVHAGMGAQIVIDKLLIFLVHLYVILWDHSAVRVLQGRGVVLRSALVASYPIVDLRCLEIIYGVQRHRAS